MCLPHLPRIINLVFIFSFSGKQNVNELGFVMCGFVQVSSGVDQGEVSNPCGSDKTTCDNVHKVVTNESTCFRFLKGIAGFSFSVSQLVKISRTGGRRLRLFT